MSVDETSRFRLVKIDGDNVAMLNLYVTAVVNRYAPESSTDIPGSSNRPNESLDPLVAKRSLPMENTDFNGSSCSSISSNSSSDKSREEIYDTDNYHAVDILGCHVRDTILTSNSPEVNGADESAQVNRKFSQPLAAISVESCTEELKPVSREGDLCRICFAQVIDCVLLPCAHLALCVSCALQLDQCPYDRQCIEKVLPIYRV